MKKLANVLMYSYNIGKKYKVIFLPEIIIISFVTLNIPLATSYFVKSAVASITLKIGIMDFFKTVIMWTLIILFLKGLMHLADYLLLQKSRIFRNQITQQINHIRMSVRYELTLDADYQKKLSIARTVMNRNIPCVVDIQNATVNLLVSFMSLCVYVSLIVKLHWGIIVICVITYVVALIININYTKFARDFRDRIIPIQRKIAYVAGRSGDVHAAKDIRVYTMASWFQGKYAQFNNEKVEIVDQREKQNHVHRTTNAFLVLIRDAVSYILLLLMYVDGRIEISDFVFFISVIATFSSLLSKIQGSIQAVYNNYMEVNDYIDFEQCSICENGIDKKLDLPESIESIEFVNVSYCYPGSSHQILSNVCFKFLTNEKIGIVGINGAGKTTLVLLMCGLLRPTKGKILLNGMDIANYDINEYHAIFSAVFQDISVLPDSVRNNISLQKEYTNEQLEKVKKMVHECGLGHIDLNSKFIKEIFDDAICLSGGEMQRLALARAIFKSSDVLILDEPTASLDPLAEQELYLNYGKFSENKISVFISHRLAATVFCDKIVLLEQGRIIEVGSHDQLMDENGKYKELFEVQRKYYKKKTSEADFL